MCQSQPQPINQSEECAASPAARRDEQLPGCTSRSNAAVRDDSLVARTDEGGRDDTADRSLRAEHARVLIPFVVQHGPQLFLLAAESSEWVLAELRFDEESCTFTEIRKVRYEWPREAFGSLLSRVAVAGDIDSDLVQETSEEFSRWLGAQFRVSSSVD